MEKDFSLGAGVVINQRGLMLFYLFKYVWDCIGRTVSRPRRRRIRAQHLDVWSRTRVSQQYWAWIRMPCHEPRDFCRVVNGCRQTYTTKTGAERFQSRQRQHQLIAALAVGQSVYFIDHHTFEASECTGRVFVRRQQRQAFGSGKQDIRRIRALPAFMRLGCIAGAVFNANGQAHFGNRCHQVAFDVGCKCFER